MIIKKLFTKTIVALACAVAVCVLPEISEFTHSQEQVYAQEYASYLDEYDEKEVLQRIYQVQNEYPEGRLWTNADTIYATLIKTDDTGRRSRMGMTGGGCYGFMLAVEKSVFDTDTFELEERTWDGDISALKAGDHIRFNKNGVVHSVVVLTVNIEQKSVTVCEGNYNSSIHWGRTISKAYMDKYASYVDSFYTKKNAAGEDIQKSGLCQDSDGEWHYYANGKVDAAYTGLVPNEYGWWYVENGKIDFACEDIVANEYGWWKVTGGAVDFTYNGIASNAYGWWKIENGQVDFRYTGLSSNAYGWWYLENGKVDFAKNDIVENKYGWWKVTDGAVDFEFTGLAPNAYGWWYLKNGAVDFTKNGKVTNEYGTWMVVNGQVIF